MGEEAAEGAEEGRREGGECLVCGLSAIACDKPPCVKATWRECWAVPSAAAAGGEAGGAGAGGADNRPLKCSPEVALMLSRRLAPGSAGSAGRGSLFVCAHCPPRSPR